MTKEIRVEDVSASEESSFPESLIIDTHKQAEKSFEESLKMPSNPFVSSSDIGGFFEKHTSCYVTLAVRARGALSKDDRNSNENVISSLNLA